MTNKSFKKKEIFIIGFTPNPRLIKRMLNEEKLFDVKTIYWNRGCEMIENNGLCGIPFTEIKIAAKNNPLKRIIPFMRFKNRVLKYLKEESPNILHVQGLDMLDIAINYQKKHKNTSIIYEIADLHRFIVDKQRKIIYRFFQNFLIRKEKKYCERISLLILTSQMYFNDYYSKIVPLDKYLYMPNIPDLKYFESFKKKFFDSKNLVIGFVGIIRYKKQIRILLDAAKITGIKLLFAGYETNGNEIEKYCIDNGYEWLGPFDFEKDISSIYSRCDVIYSVYDADMHNCQVALPNKLYEAIYCELPIIVAKNTHLSNIVEKLGVGFSVSHNDVSDLIEAIEILKKRECYEKIVANCKKNKNIVNLNKYNEILNLKLNELFYEIKEI